MTICRGLNIKISWRRVLDMCHLPRFGEEIAMPGHDDHPLPGCNIDPQCIPGYSNISTLGNHRFSH